MLHQILECISIVTLFICLDNVIFARPWSRSHRITAVLILILALVSNIFMYSQIKAIL